MNSHSPGRTILLLSIPLAVLVTIASCVGLFTPGFFAAETPNWQAQSTGQDMVDLFLIAPCLLISSILAYKNNRAAMMIWGGVVLYLCYTFTIYCFSIHFNRLFIIYCSALGLSFYSSLYFLFSIKDLPVETNPVKKKIARVFAIYFLFIAVAFYFLWLSEIIPAVIAGSVPESLKETGLFTNAVHVIDLAVFLPGIFLTGILLLKGRSVAFILAPALLAFFVLMDISIGVLIIVMREKGLEGSLAIAAVMGLLALISLVLLAWYFKSSRTIQA